MRDLLIGCTGFVGGNLAAQHDFTHAYHSTDIQEAYGSNPDLLVYAGLPAEMYLANHYPDKDREVVRNAMHNIEEIHPECVVLISTIAVYDDPVNVDESAEIKEGKLSVYGKNRRDLEKFVETSFPTHLIMRLPALFGEGLKKNFIYDLIHVIPAALTASKFEELQAKDGLLREYYTLQKDGFYHCRKLNQKEAALLREHFENLGFSAVNFTDSRSVYQYYHLSYLWQHIEKALSAGIPVLNTATEPIACTELYRTLYGKEFRNEIPGKKPYYYDYRTKYAAEFDGADGYLFRKDQVMQELVNFIREQKQKF